MPTVTEVLAEIATIDKRLPKKIADVQPYVWRYEAMRDPFEKDGGSAKYLAEQRQSFEDLLERKIKLRREIARSNDATDLTVDGEVRIVADWLVWKREVYPQLREFLSRQVRDAQTARQQAQRSGGGVVMPGTNSKPDDVVINIDEQQAIKDLEALEEKYGKLDGLLSLKNATTEIDI